MKIQIKATNIGSIRAAIKQVAETRKEVKRRRDRFIALYCNRVRELAWENIAKYEPEHDFILSQSIAIENKDDGRARIFVDDQNAIYFEYGTGPAGAKHPHPAGGDYKGSPWITRADGKDMEALYNWKNIAEPGEEPLYMSFGQPSHPFWYETVQTATSADFIAKCWRDSK
nr:MAG TPA: hypothetical protein [Caudoviricetes sp.]